MKISARLKEIIPRFNSPYLYYHAPRYQHLLSLVEQYADQDSRILDIGNSPFAPILHEIRAQRIDELGLHADSDEYFGRRFHFDLNHTIDHSLWRNDIGTYDLITFAEVMEHLYTAPIFVLEYLKSLLNPGGILIIQTPNAVVMHKRLVMMTGKNPFMLITKTRQSPGHFREYTMAETISFLKEAKLQVVKADFKNYFDYRYSFEQSGSGKKRPYLRILNVIYGMCPGSWKPGLSLVAQKPH